MLYQASLFSQVLSLIDRGHFASSVQALHAEKASKGFTCWGQLVAMLFCQLAQAKSLREIVQGLRSCEGKINHLGIPESPKRSTLSYANAHRPWQLYQKVFYALLERCMAVAPAKKFRFKNKLLTMDATIIELCASMFDWAKFRQAKGALKVHLLLDHDGYLPVFAHITEGREHELLTVRKLHFGRGTIVVFDRAYIDYKLFAAWTKQGVFFVTRLKENANVTVVEHREPPKGSSIRKDETIILNFWSSTWPCKAPLRRVEVWVEEKQETLVLLTNNFRLSARTIAAIYKDRWQVELFFKALKQNLRVKTFVGTSTNAVHIQIWTALIAILLLKYLQFRSSLSWALSNLVALLRWNLFTYRDLWEWINKPFETPPGTPVSEQMMLVLDSR